MWLQNGSVLEAPRANLLKQGTGFGREDEPLRNPRSAVVQAERGFVCVFRVP